MRRATLATAGERQRLLAGAVRGTVAAMTMTALRQVTTGLGLVEQTPPDAILKQRAFGVVVRKPRLAFFLATRQVALVEMAHWRDLDRRHRWPAAHVTGAREGRAGSCSTGLA